MEKNDYLCGPFRSENMSSSPQEDPQDLSARRQTFKRKLSPTAAMRPHSQGHNDDPRPFADELRQIADMVDNDLHHVAADDPIQECGFSILNCMETYPADVTKLAGRKLHTWPYASVPQCWTRLFEDSSLKQAEQLLRAWAEDDAAAPSMKRTTDDQEDWPTAHEEPTPSSDRDWLAEILAVLDTSIITTGVPRRRSIITAVIQRVEEVAQPSFMDELPSRFQLDVPVPLVTEYPICQSSITLSFEAFQHHLDKFATPILVPDMPSLTDSPAFNKWQDPNYLMALSSGGRRLVPVEIGRSYTDDGWGQKIMALRKYMVDYLLPKHPKEIGYLAQYDLAAHIPALREDIRVPDYCYTTPPDPDASALKTAGLSSAPALDDPLVNMWIGPKGTKSPLHTDPYHNILCQVLGYKYVRLYSPDQSAKVYPRGRDETGVNMDNTSGVDVSLFLNAALGQRGRGGILREGTDMHALEEAREQFPRFEQAEFVEGILGPGQCLYIPVGWWHYVESLSTSCSVSYWWN